MLDIGWTELLVIAVVLIVVVGPKDLPPMIRAFGKMTKRLRQTAGEFRAQFDEALREAELDDLKNSVNDIRSLNPANSIRETLNPLRQMGQEIKSDLERSTRPQSKPAPLDDGYEENSILPEVPLGLGDVPDALKPAVVQPSAQPAAPAPTASVTAPATSAPAAPAPAVAKKATSSNPATKAVAAAKAAPKSTKSASVDVAAPVTAPPAAKRPKVAADRATATAPADKPIAKAAPEPRKPKSEDRA
jgi:sec-independent protein translocase protein TatB